MTVKWEKNKREHVKEEEEEDVAEDNRQPTGEGKSGRETEPRTCVKLMMLEEEEKTKQMKKVNETI